MIETQKLLEVQKKAFYAALGAPVFVGKRLSERINERISEANTKFDETRERLTKEARTEFEAWAKEGEELLARIQEGKVVEDLTHRMDVDQFQEQVGKLRGQLEDMLETWRANFLPERAEDVKAAAKKVTVEVTEPAPAKKAPARKPAAKTTTAAKKPAAKTTTARTTAAKKAPAKKAPAKKPAAKTTTAAKKPAAKTASATSK